MSLRHPHIVTFIGTCFNKNNFYLVTEYLEKQSLKKLLDDSSQELSFLDRLKMILDIAIAILYLHSRSPRVYHRDLKSSNILVDSHNRVKLCDFGISKIYDQFTQMPTNSSSTCFWMAPEFIQDGVFSDRSDVYSFAILMWEIITRDTRPFKGIREITFLVGGDILKNRPKIPENLNRDVKGLIERCWDGDPNKRPDIKTIVENLEDLYEKELKNK
jgi:serine/threonine protein kinase